MVGHIVRASLTRPRCALNDERAVVRQTGAPRLVIISAVDWTEPIQEGLISKGVINPEIAFRG